MIGTQQYEDFMKVDDSILDVNFRKLPPISEHKIFNQLSIKLLKYNS